MNANALHKDESKNKRTAWIVTLVIHLIILLFFWFYNIWPFNPPPEPLYGIQVNFGTSEVGTGDNQKLTQNTSEQQNTEKSEPSESSATENTEESSETVLEGNEEVMENNETESVESESENTNENTENNSDTETQESTEEQSENSEESTNNNSEESSENTENSQQGNDLYGGDKGDENGEINESDIYKGQSSGSGGVLHTFAGWEPLSIPKPSDNSDESGKIVFKVRIDKYGDIVSVIPIENRVSSRLMNIYKQEVEKMTFKRTSPSAPAEYSEGTITFNIRSR